VSTKIRFDPDVFVRAAEQIHIGFDDYCCNALNYITRWDENYTDLFEAVTFPSTADFESDPKLCSYAWYGSPKYNREARILALLLCALLLEEGFEP
jgi:hypothetical protein